MKTYNTLRHLNGNLLAGVDFETTGDQPGYHEIIQIAIVPLDSDFQPSKELRPFYQNIRPNHPERADPVAMRVHNIKMEELLLNAPSQERVADMVIEWFYNLDLPVNRCLVPVVWNWAFESGFGKAWLGTKLWQELFHSHARDGMLFALALNDRAAFAGEPCPFDRVGLKKVAKRYDIVNENPHDAFADSITGAKTYRAMLQHELF
jgi:DNA polymerase III epsilon subunit-like protein